MFAKKLRESLDSNALVLQLEGEIEVIPFANIQSITVVPASEDVHDTEIARANAPRVYVLISSSYGNASLNADWSAAIVSLPG